MFLKSFFTLILSSTCIMSVFAQAKIYGAPQSEGEYYEIPIGASEVKSSFKNIQSLEVEAGTVLVLFERYSNGKISGRHRLVTASEANFEIGFNPAYAIAFENPENLVMGFEEPNFSGTSMTFATGRNEITDDFGLSSIYIPKGVSVKLYTTDPQLYPNQEIEHRPMNAGVRPYVGGDIDNKVKFVYVQ